MSETNCQKQQYADFLERYKSFSRQHQDERYRDFTTRFRQMQTGFQSVSKLVDELKRRDGGNYNIFRVLGIERKEVKTHSAFLADLLDPNGSHCQGYLFLREFLKLCRKHISYFDYSEQEIVGTQWFVTTEKHTCFGNLDIVLSCPKLGYLIVFENKIDAGEQERQLERYGKWLESEQHFFPKQTRRLLLYLTRRGDQSDTADEFEYTRLSYHHELYMWLGSCMPHVQSSRVREIVRQYAELIKII